MLDGARVLVLNQTYEPIHICNARRAIRMVLLGKAVSIEDDGLLVRSESFQFRLPAVIRLLRFVHIPRTGDIPFSKKNIWRRDNYTCQYCGSMDAVLTVDHVIPRSRGGLSSWENVLCCCRACNARKGDRLPHEAGMTPLRPPRKPRFFHPEAMGPRLNDAVRQHWSKYLRPFEPSR
ncbi:MAG: HNH endonuclease [Candidatus Tectomicrobia bacterium]|uniref:HNH endonuclease n=1 Tax=Tectimicrobiota bacterium TaxID=2528274 RepID=A0A932HYB4_UNCTE|nr:HNH endonuclease [Candidatus Tectomicrobia bacterium]